MHLRRVFISLLALSFVTPFAARSEGCTFVGCEGSVGYIPILDSQSEGNWDGLWIYGSEGKIYLRNRQHLLKERGVPLVNENVTLAWDKMLLMDMDNVKASLPKLKFAVREGMVKEPHESEGELRYFDLEVDGLWMSAGAQLRILGYTLFEDVLFALVIYQSDQ